MYRSLVRASSIRFKESLPNAPSNGETVCRTRSNRADDPSSKVEEDARFDVADCQRSPSVSLDGRVTDDTEATDETEAVIREVTPAKKSVSELISRLEQLHSHEISMLNKAEGRASLLQQSLTEEQRQANGAAPDKSSHYGTTTPTGSSERALSDVLHHQSRSLDLNALLDRINLDDVDPILQRRKQQIGSDSCDDNSVSHSLLSEISRALSLSSADYDYAVLLVDDGKMLSFDLKLCCNEDASCASSVTWDNGDEGADDLSTLSDLDDILLVFELNSLDDL